MILLLKNIKKYEENRVKLNDWIMTNDRIKDEAKENFKNTDYALQLYNKIQDDLKLREPQFSDFYQPSVQQKQGESQEAGVSEDKAKIFLMKQAIWQIYLPAPRTIPRPTFDVDLPNAVHQADLLFLPHDKLPRGKKIFKYALTVVDIASRFKAAEPLTSKDSSEVSRAFRKIYKGPLKWPKILQVDPGREFMGTVTEEMKKHDVRIRRGNVNVHRDQERFD